MFRKTPVRDQFIRAAILAGLGVGFYIFGHWQGSQGSGTDLPAATAKKISSTGPAGSKKSPPESRPRMLTAGEAQSRLENALAGNFSGGMIGLSDVISHIVAGIKLSEIPALVYALADEPGIITPKPAENTFGSSAHGVNDAPDTKAKQDLIRQLVLVLAQNDPTAALNLIDNLTDNPSQFFPAVVSAFSLLAKTDPPQALDYLAQFPLNNSNVNAITYQSLFTRLGASDPAGAVKLAKRIPPGPEHDNAMSALAQGWSFTDPKAALNWAASLPASEPAVISKMLLTRIAENSPQVALISQYISTIPDEATRDAYILRLAPVLGAGPQKDPVATMDWLNRAVTGDTYAKAVNSVIVAFDMKNAADATIVLDKITNPEVLAKAIATIATNWGKSDPQAALTWAVALPAADATTQASAVNLIVASWSKNDPNAVAAYVQNSADPSAFLPADPAIAQSLAASNPQAALTFANNLPDGDTKNRALNNVLVTISQSDFTTAWTDAAALPATDDPIGIMTNLVSALANKDPAQAAELIAQFPIGAAQDNVTSTVAAIWVSQDPQAFTVWLTSLPSGDVRDSAIAQLAASSQATKNPTGVLEWVNTVSNPQIKASLLEKLAPAQLAEP